MSLRTPNGKTLTRTFRTVERRYDWINKLRKNVRPKLDRLATVAVLLPSSLTPPKQGNRITLAIRGDNDENAKIAKILDITVDEINSGKPVTVKFSR